MDSWFWFRSGIVTAAVAASLIVVPPAYALPTIGNGVCNAGNVCMWQHTGETGALADAAQCEPDWYCGLQNLAEWWYFNNSISPNDRTSSIWVRSGERPWAMFTKDWNGQGTKRCYPLGSHVTTTQLSGAGLQDEISSMWTEDFTEC